jgi:toxin secretion/phage lysis holin
MGFQMQSIWAWVQIALAALGGWLGWLLGGMESFVYMLVAFVVLDYITGIMCAVVDKNLSSAIGFRGIFKKITIFAMVAVGHMVDMNLIGPLGTVGDGSAIRTAIIFFYLANEGLSLLENSSRLGLPIPQKLKDVLAQLNKRDASKDDG